MASLRLVLAPFLVASIVAACSSYDEEGAPAPTPPGDDGGGESDASTSVDGSVPVGTFAIACGAETCKEDKVCCVTPPAGGAPITHDCVAKGTACATSFSARLDCDDDVDCVALGSPGAICCGSLLPNVSPTRLDKAICTAPSNCAVLPEDYRMCDPLRTDQCPSGKPCIQIKMVGAAAVTTPFYACQKTSGGG